MREKPLILIVDDEKEFREIAKAELSAGGFEIAEAASGEDAIKKAGELVPDLILMDINMPGMAGTEAAMTIREDAKTKDVKIAFLTNFSDPFPGFTGEHASVTKELGLDAFLNKTDDPKGLADKVRAILSASNAVATASNAASGLQDITVSPTPAVPMPPTPPAPPQAPSA